MFSCVKMFLSYCKRWRDAELVKRVQDLSNYKWFSTLERFIWHVDSWTVVPLCCDVYLTLCVLCNHQFIPAHLSWLLVCRLVWHCIVCNGECVTDHFVLHMFIWSCDCLACLSRRRWLVVQFEPMFAIGWLVWIDVWDWLRAFIMGEVLNVESATVLDLTALWCDWLIDWLDWMNVWRQTTDCDVCLRWNNLTKN